MQKAKLESDQMTATKNEYNNNMELTDLPDGSVCLCVSYRGFSIKPRLSYNQLKVPCCAFNYIFHC